MSKEQNVSSVCVSPTCAPAGDVHRIVALGRKNSHMGTSGLKGIPSLLVSLQNPSAPVVCADASMFH
jgi:hypothetical protein